MMNANHKQSGFTFIELLVVMAIIAVLSSILVTAVNQARAKARDTKRKGDLSQLQKAVELYYNTNNVYPCTNSCNYATPTALYGYTGTACLGSYTLTGASGYIPNLAPTFLGALPTDPKPLTSGCSGYQYESDGVNYKIISANNTVAGTGGPEILPTAGQPFYDPARPTTAIMVTNSINATSSSTCPTLGATCW